MKYILYYTNIYGVLVLHYSDDDGKSIRERYSGYSLDEALRRFREKHALKGKHIDIASIDSIGGRK